MADDNDSHEPILPLPPVPAAGEVLIRIRAFGLNHAETYMRNGSWGQVAEAGRYQAKPVAVFGFDQIVEAHRAMEEGTADGKMTVAVP
jgi:NADPH:quinone reductase-like Zn-dependent oxidoreductase